MKYRTFVPNFGKIFLTSLILVVLGAGGLIFIVFFSEPTLGPRWLFFFFLTICMTGLALPFAYILQRRIAKQYVSNQCFITRIHPLRDFRGLVDLAAIRPHPIQPDDLDPGRRISSCWSFSCAWPKRLPSNPRARMMNELQNIPAVDSLLKTSTAQNLSAFYGRELLLQALRETLENLRADIQSGEDISIPDAERILADTEKILHHWVAPSLKPIINATGIILHTNLGRAPISAEIAASHAGRGSGLFQPGIRSIRRQARETLAARRKPITAPDRRGKRFGGQQQRRSGHAGAECSGKRGKRVVIAHSQLVEIGGGFRVPDVMRQSGAKLVAVGTTNRVHTADYERALREESPALVLTAHHSNFKIIGFTTEPELSDIAAVTHAAGLLLVNDLGSGALLDTAAYGLKHEPTVQEALVRRGGRHLLFRRQAAGRPASRHHHWPRGPAG